MPNISSLTMPSGIVYDIKDAEARENIQTIFKAMDIKPVVKDPIEWNLELQSIGLENATYSLKETKTIDEMLSDLDSGRLKINRELNESYDIITLKDFVMQSGSFPEYQLLAKNENSSKTQWKYTFYRLVTQGSALSANQDFFIDNLTIILLGTTAQINQSYRPINDNFLLRVSVGAGEDFSLFKGASISWGNSFNLEKFLGQKTDAINIKKANFFSTFGLKTVQLYIHYYFHDSNNERIGGYLEFHKEEILDIPSGQNGFLQNVRFICDSVRLKKRIILKVDQNSWSDTDYPTLIVDDVIDLIEVPPFDPVEDEGKILKIVSGTPIWVTE